MSPFYQRSGRVLNINLTETRKKKIVSFLPSTESVQRLGDVGASHFSRSEMIAFARVSDLSFLRSVMIGRL
jgi:hypothetical protein